MSDALLKQRLGDAATDLSSFVGVFAGAPTKLRGDARPILENVGACAGMLTGAIDVVDYRAACWAALVAVRDTSDPATGTSPIGAQRIPFEHARMLASQGYVAATWSLADVVATAAGRALCTEQTAKNNTRSHNLWAHFQKDGGSACWSVVGPLRECFAWPVAVSYAIRNLLTHEAGLIPGARFFDGPSVGDGFRMSDDAWAVIERKVQNEYKVQSSQTRGGGIDPGSSRRLDVILQNCHTELDTALGILVRTSCAMAKSYVGLLHE